MKRRLGRVTLLFLLITSTGFLVSFDTPNERYFDIAKNMEILSSVYAEVNRYYVDDVDPNALMKTGIDAMLASLDPYTNYIPEDDIEDFRFMSTGQYGGIGAMIGNRENKITILMPYKGFPAYNAGLKIGDELIEIDGQNVEGKKTSEISKLLKGQAGTEVKLLVKRPNEKNNMPMTLERQKITVKSVPYYGMLTEDVGYFKLNSFTQEASKEITEAINSLLESGAKKFVFDLRGNTGGLLREAISISNLFIPKGKEVVSTRGKVSKWNNTYMSQKTPLVPNAPLIILTNGRSASASEIVSGVIQDYDRGVLIGSKTFGKGLVQATRPIVYNSQVKITTAKYYIPSGRCIQAIDYSNKGDDGNATKIPDSLLVEHKTANGRVVYDGAGIAPDVEVEHDQYPDVLIGLVEKNHLFNFATTYYYNHDTIESAREFHLSDEEYDQFKDWMKAREFKFKVGIEKSLDKFSAEVEKQEKVALQEELNIIQRKINESKSDDLDEYKDEIIEALEQEIASRYFLQEGLLEASFDHDKDISKALDILNDSEVYAKVLGTK